MTEIINLSRRDFLQGSATVAGGLLLGVAIPSLNACAKKPPVGEFQPNAFIRIDPSGEVTIIAARSEMGQGIRTGLPAVIADELEADWSRVRVEQGDGDKKYGDQNTDGSQSVRKLYQPMRETGAAAREMLVVAAASLWEVDPSECVAREHRVHHEATDRSFGYGELAGTAASLPVPDEPELKSRDQFRYIGKPVPIVDLDDITVGKAQFGIDTVLPGMLFASIERPPTVGGGVASYEASAALAVSGVEQVDVIESSGLPPAFKALGGVAVLANNTWAAEQGRKKLEIQWNPGPNSGFDSESYRAQLEQTCKEPGEVVRSRGDVDEALASSERTVEASYYVPLLAHATMEPPSATARYADGKLEVWAATQAPQTAQSSIATYLGMEPEDVTVHVTLLGGGFGRKSKPDFIAEAAYLAKKVGKPVKVTWTREDDIRHDYFHAPSAQHFKGALDEQGNTTAWLHRSVFPTIVATFNADADKPADWEVGQGSVDMPFDIANIRAERGKARAHVRIGWLRSVINIPLAFGVNSFAGELAAAAGRDPRDYLLELIGSPRLIDLTEDGAENWNYGEDIADYPFDTGRLRGVIELAAAQAGWGRTLPEGHGLGIAAHRSFLTYIATVSEVSVDADNKLTVHRVDCAVDCGTVINPDRVRAQAEGAIIFGLTLALYGNITAEGGVIQQGNFDSYPMMRIDAAPREINIHLVDSDALPTGIGEPGVPPVAPSITNAIFAATGKRYRDLPLRKHLRV